MKTKLSGALILGVLVLDLWSKRWALSALGDGTRMEILGGFVPLTLAFNRGAAFGLSIGGDPRWFFIPVTLLAVGFLSVLLLQARSDDYLRLVAVSLVLGGALGNLYDRLRWDRGVVDFLGPIDLGIMDWPIFNVADMGITCGAVLLAISFWGEEEETTAVATDAAVEPGSSSQGQTESAQG